MILDNPYQQILDLFESRNIIIQDRDYATRCLSDISYYSLVNGYKDIFSHNIAKNFLAIIQVTPSLTLD